MAFAKRALLIVALAPTGITYSQQPSARSDEALDRLRKTVPGLVKMFVYCNADVRPWTGAGVVYTDSGHILTAAHLGNACMQGADSVKVGAVTSPYEAPRPMFRAKLIQRAADQILSPSGAATDTAHFQDVAIYQLNPGQERVPAARLATQTIIPGDAIHVAGFADLPYNANKERIIGGPTIFRTSIQSVKALPDGSAQRLHYEGGTWPGLSGGPVYNTLNEVVGVHSSRRGMPTENLLNSRCDPMLGPQCVGNAVSFEVRNSVGEVQRKVINVDITVLKGLLDHFGWASSVDALPSGWPRR